MPYLGFELALMRPGVRRVSEVRKRNIFLRNYGSGKRAEPTARTVGEISSCRFIMSAGRAWRLVVLNTIDVRVGNSEDNTGLINNESTIKDLKDLGRSCERTPLSTTYY